MSERPHNLQAMLQEALAHHAAGRLQPAEVLYRQVLAADPQNFDALHMLGLLAHHAGQTRAGVELMNRAAGINPAVPELHTNLATAWLALGHAAQALRHGKEAVRLRPDFVTAHALLAMALTRLGDLPAAADAWRRVTMLAPNDAEPHANLGAVLHWLGRPADAFEALRRATDLEPNNAQNVNSLGAILYELGRPDDAAQLHQRAIQLKPDYAPAYVDLARAHQLAGRIDEALAAARKAVELDPNHVGGWQNVAAALQERGDVREAQSACDRAVTLLAPRRATDPATAQLADRLRLMSLAMLPQVYASTDEMMQWRRELSERIGAMKAEGLRLPLDVEPAPTLFQLAYHGLDDREIMADYARLLRPPPDPPMERRAPSIGKIRVGFVSRFFSDHTIGRLNVGLIERLDRSAFEVIVFTVGQPTGDVAARIRKAADRTVVLPGNLAAARQLIRDARPDVLFYTDLGMDPVTYSLAYSRLAAVQCTTWGHPVTSGIPAIDYFISSDLLEPPESDAQYTEKPVRLKSLAVYYERPTLPANVAPPRRAEFDLPEDTHLYGSLQMLWKFHPDFDALLAGVLRRDPKGELLLIRGLDRRWDDMLQSRFARVMPDVIDRVRWLPRQSYENFLRLTSLCDVMLDPPQFGGGNTTYEALAFAVPVVTLPSPLMRGRISLALYRMMGIDDCVAASAQDYVERAVTLAGEDARRGEVRQKLADASSKIFESTQGVQELEHFWRGALLSPLPLGEG